MNSLPNALAIASRVRLVRQIAQSANGKLMKVAGSLAYVEIPADKISALAGLWAKNGFVPCPKETRLVTSPGKPPQRVQFYIVDLKDDGASAPPVVEVRRQKRGTRQ